MSLQVQELYKTFGEKVAVDHLSFEMQEAGVFGLIGTNGAGKTTTIRMILGILQPDGGSACWDGRPITRETLSFGYMPEERGLYMKNKVIDQLIYFGQLRGMTREAAKKSALSYMERLDVLQYQNMTAEKLSKGNQQKIQLIATLIHDPQLIFLDEPFSGLDPVNTELLRGLICELKEDNRFIVMSSHQMATVEEYCENLVILHHGKTVLSGNLRSIKASYGHTNLIVGCGEGEREQAAKIAEGCGLKLLEQRATESEYKITGDEMGSAFLKALVAAGCCPLKFEIREPSLNEIFIEKAGGEA